jgi:DNA-binding response OmpR family regulator
MPVDKQQHARILIIEDEPTLARDLQDLLVEEGFEIAGVAGRLEKALALIESVAWSSMSIWPVWAQVPLHRR